MNNLFRIIIFLLLLCNLAFSEILVEGKQNKFNNFTIDYFYDANKSLTIDEILQQNFTTKINNKFNLGNRNGNSWLKFEITNNTNQDTLFLHIVESYFDLLDLYEKKDEGWSKKSSGRFAKLDERDMYDISPVFSLHVKKNTTKTFYVKMNAKFSQFGEFRIYTKSSPIAKYRLILNSFYIFFLGSLFIMIVFNSFLFTILKERIYFYYVSYLFSFSAFFINANGFLLYLGWFNSYSTIHIISISFINIFLTLFSISFLNVERNFPNIQKILKVFITLNFFFMIMSYINLDFWYPKLTILGLTTYIILLYVSIRSWLIGRHQAKYYLFAVSIYIFSIIVFSLMTKGLLPNNYFTKYAFLYSSFLEVVVFSLLLAHRFINIQKEKLRIQDELIKFKNENEDFLKQEVESRTEKIECLLQDKDVLLKEVYHRVKNNFQLIVSLLVLEKTKFSTEAGKKNFSLLINRIKSMATVHQSLYGSETISKLDSYEYISKITKDVKEIYLSSDVEIVENIESLHIQIEHAIPLGIIINEVLTNAIKHNLDLEQKLIVSVSFKSNKDKNELIIQDNGKGFEYDPTKHKQTLGINLLGEFCKKLPNSNFEYTNHNGLLFRLTFH